MLTWDILRYHEMKVGVLRNCLRQALESLIHKVQVRGAMKGGDSVLRTEANQFVTQWFSDLASRLAIREMFEKAGYPPNAVEVEAFQLAFPHLGTWRPCRSIPPPAPLTTTHPPTTRAWMLCISVSAKSKLNASRFSTMCIICRHRRTSTNSIRLLGASRRSNATRSAPIQS